MLIIYLNQRNVVKDITPRYTRIKIPDTLPMAKFTKKKIIKKHAMDEIQFSYIHKKFYQLHIMLTTGTSLKNQLTKN